MVYPLGKGLKLELSMLPKDSTLKMKFFPTQEALPIMRTFLAQSAI